MAELKGEGVVYQCIQCIGISESRVSVWQGICKRTWTGIEKNNHSKLWYAIHALS